MFVKAMNALRKLWSTSGFEDAALTGYAEQLLFADTRKGLALLSFVTLAILLSSAVMFHALNFEWVYSQTFLLLGLLSLHILISSRYIREIRGLNLLGLTLVVIIGAAFVLLAQYSGRFNPVLLANVVLLFMVIPLLPWALRESMTAIGLIYLIFSLSTLTVDGRFKPETIWLLQFLMVSAGFATLTVIARQVSVRKHDIATRFELEIAHRTMEALSYKDPLTSAYNRRFLTEEFERIRSNYRAIKNTLHFALVDLDDFKQLNDSQGHEAGDKALQTLSATFLAYLEPGDYLFRLGGDEFALIFGAQDPNAWLNQLPENCRREGLSIAYSVGLASLRPDQDVALTDLYNLADGRLYASKRGRKLGRKQVESDSSAVARVF